jgi:uncharacterized protein
MVLRSLASAVLSALVLTVVACGDDDETKTVTSAAQPVVPAERTTPLPRFEGEPAAQRSPRGADLFNEIGAVPRASAATLAPKVKGSDVPLPQYLDTLGNDIAQFWQRQFNAAGYRFPASKQIVVTRNATTGCNGREEVTPNTSNAFYCPADETIYLPVNYIERKYAILGDAPPAFVTAHEWAHRVQHVNGTLRLKAEGKLLTKQTELQADCLAGVWASTVFRRGDLEEGDLDEFYNAVASVGDPPGTPSSHPGAHGSAEEREASFKRGYDAANTQACAILPG